MADRRKILGQVAPPAGTSTLLYSATSETTISTIFGCNTGGAPGTFRLWVRRKGEETSSKQYLYYDESLGIAESIAITCGITLDVGDDVMVNVNPGTISFNAFGVVRE